MDGTLTIRRFRDGDEPALLAVFRASVHGLAARDYLPAQLAAWAPLDPDEATEAAWRIRLQVNRPFVAEVDGVAIAFADLQSDGLIDQFFVAPSHARQGAGGMLMAAILAEAEALGLPVLTSHVSLTAQPFFARFGFEVVAHRMPVVRGVAISNALMRKRRVTTADDAGEKTAT